MAEDIQITPNRNGNCVTFSLTKDLIPPGTGLSFPDPQSAQTHPLAKALFDIPGVRSVWILGNDVSVTRDEKFRWPGIQSRVIETIHNLTNSG